MPTTGAPSLFRRLYDSIFRIGIQLVELDVVPDFLLRIVIRMLLGQRYRDLGQALSCAHVPILHMTMPGDARQARLQAFVDELKKMPIAIQTATANEQHYEVPTEYFLLCLGKHLKYSSCYYPTPSSTLSEAEECMLAMTCERADLTDGQDILELGCGWGSLSLFMAARYPSSKVTSVSNSRTQKQFIDSQAKQRGLTNLTVITADMVEFQAPSLYDRVVSVEMFEHMKNYKMLLDRIASWLRPSGKLFVHIFVNQRLPYHFEVAGEDDWMAKYFFSGGTMPSATLLLYFQDALAVQRQWYVNGRHYSRTLEDWLSRQDAHRVEIMPLFKKCYGERQALRWWVYWRLFYLACSELFKYNGGEEWGVGHYLFVKKGGTAQTTPAAPIAN